MKADRLVYTVTLWLRSPFLFRGLTAGLVGVDVAQLRDENGDPILPASQLRGMLREALRDLATAKAGITEQEIDDLFGRASDDKEKGREKENKEGTTNDPMRGAILVGDLTAAAACMVRDADADADRWESLLEPLPEAGETTRIEIDDNFGSVKKGALQVLELVAPFGAAVRFCGHIVLFRPQKEAERYAELLDNALRLVASIGALKSPGFGEVIAERSSVTFTRATSLALPDADKAGSLPDFLRLRVRFDRPLLVDAEKIAGNTFRGNHIVPGAVFKGALARRLELAGTVPSPGTPAGKALSGLSVSHAFPESAEQPGRPYGLPLPLSLVAVNEATFADALLIDRGKGAMIDGKPAKFTGNWKAKWFGGALDLLGYPKDNEPPDLPRTHTALEDGVAKDQALFTTIARSVKDRSWLLDIDLSGLDDALKSTAWALLQALEKDGLDGIGKTGAHASFERIHDAKPPEPKPLHGKDKPNHYAIMLTTPTLMLDPAKLWNDKGEWLQDFQDPHNAYAAYWQWALPGAVMHGFFAEQSLSGGYLARRRRLYGAGTYFPFLLTKPGAVFLIETEKTDRLAELCRLGLPVPDLAQTREPISWQTCPYLPENGYGRITADYLSKPAQFELTRRVHDV